MLFNANDAAYQLPLIIMEIVIDCYVTDQFFCDRLYNTIEKFCDLNITKLSSGHCVQQCLGIQL